MASKDEVINWIKANAPTEAIDGDTFKVLMEWNDGRSQILFVLPRDQVLEVFSPFAQENEVSAQQAIQANTSVFGVDFFAGMYGLKHVLPIENVDENELVFGIKLLAEAADEFEKKLGLGDNL